MGPVLERVGAVCHCSLRDWKLQPVPCIVIWKQRLKELATFLVLV